jgi:hypothetical protein
MEKTASTIDLLLGYSRYIHEWCEWRRKDCGQNYSMTKLKNKSLGNFCSHLSSPFEYGCIKAQKPHIISTDAVILPYSIYVPPNAGFSRHPEFNRCATITVCVTAYGQR